MEHIRTNIARTKGNPLPSAKTGVAVLRTVGNDVHGIISRAVSLARAAGRDYDAQSRAAATAILAVRPDLSMDEALQTVFFLRET